MFDIIVHYLHDFLNDIVVQIHDPWKVFGIASQSLFMMRFLVQWIASEKAGRSTIPIAFWYFSIAGALSLLIYGIREREVVIILGQSLPLGIYVRNLYLIYHSDKNIINNPLDETPISIEASQTKSNDKNYMNNDNTRLAYDR
jgi:lipid-A-disaccharide synthase-like uncharacterized protein